jgi:hypothetical protein
MQSGHHLPYGQPQAGMGGVPVQPMHQQQQQQQQQAAALHQQQQQHQIQQMIAQNQQRQQHLQNMRPPSGEPQMQAMPIRAYLDQTVVPILLDG